MAEETPINTGAVLVSQNPAQPPAPEGPPVVVDAPYASQTGSTLSCTMGNWQNVPTIYIYRWLKAGTPVGRASTDPAYAVVAADNGVSYACQLTAANSVGQGVSLSNAVIVVA